jgi:hypothetical protein
VQPVHAGEGFFIGPFVFSPSVTLSLGADDNIFGLQNGTCTAVGGECVPVAPVAGTVSTIRGYFALKLPFSHSYSSLIWNPQYRTYGQYDSPRTTSNTLIFDTQLNFSNGTVFSIHDDYIDGYEDYKTTSTEGVLQFGSADYTRNHPGIEYEWTIADAWGMSARAERYNQKYGSTDAIPFNDFVSGRTQDSSTVVDQYNYISNTVELSAFRNFSHVRLYTTATAGRTDQDRTAFNESSHQQCREAFDPDGDGTLNVPHPCPAGIDFDQIDQESISLGVTGEIFPRTVGDVQIGVASWQFKDPGTPGYSGVILSARLDHTFSPRTHGYFGTEIQPLQAPAQVTGYYLRTDLLFGADRWFTQHLLGRAGFTIQHYAFSGSSNIGEETFTDVIAELELRYRPGQEYHSGPWQLSLLYNPYRRLSVAPNLAYETNRVTLAIQYGWF